MFLTRISSIHRFFFSFPANASSRVRSVALRVLSTLLSILPSNRKVRVFVLLFGVGGGGVGIFFRYFRKPTVNPISDSIAKLMMNTDLLIADNVRSSRLFEGGARPSHQMMQASLRRALELFGAVEVEFRVLEARGLPHFNAPWPTFLRLYWMRAFIAKEGVRLSLIIMQDSNRKQARARVVTFSLLCLQLSQGIPRGIEDPVILDLLSCTRKEVWAVCQFLVTLAEEVRDLN